MKVRSRRKSSNQKFYRITLFVVALLVLGLVLPIVVTSVGRVLLYPVYATQLWFQESTAAIPTLLREKSDLRAEIKELESALALAQSSNVTQQRLFEENVWLRELLGAERDDRIAAAVVARPNQLPYDFLQIDQGVDAGVTEGAPVYVGIDNVIGVVAHAAPDFAFVELFTSPGFEITSYVSGANIIATLEGFGGGVARVRVPQGIPLSIGNLVHVPSIQPGVFGRINYIEGEPTQPEQFGYLTMNKPIASIHYVAVGRQAIEPANAEAVETAVQSIFETQLLVDSLDATFTATTSTSTNATSTN